MARWPEAEIDLYAEFLRHEPAPEERIELSIAQLSALAYNRTRGEGETSKSLADFLVFRDPWADELAKPFTLDTQVMRQLDSIGRKNKG